MNSLILLAGGSGIRMQKDLPKQFLMLAGKPVIMHIMERIERIEEISEVIVVCLNDYKEYIKDYINKYDLKKPYKIVDGGKTRQESVFNGLKSAQYDNVILHEAARPFVTVTDFKRLISSEYRNAIYAIDIPFTVLTLENDLVSGILERKSLLNVQLPQKFEKVLLINAHYKAQKEDREFTEDASLLYFYEEIDIHIIKGMDYNIKLSNSLDLIVADEIYKEYMMVN